MKKYSEYELIKMNKLQKKLGDGTNYGMLYILFGFMLIPWLITVAIGFIFFNIDLTPTLILHIIFGLFLELYCSIQREKIKHNNKVYESKQLNLFEFIK